MTFSTPKIVKNDSSKLPKWAKFWLFSELFGSCSRSIWALFKAYKLWRSINDPDKIFGQNFCHFGSFERSFLTILGNEKIIFWTFSKLFCSCLGSLRALFTTLKDQFLSVFLAYYKLFATHTCSSPLRSREALINVDKASSGVFIILTKTWGKRTIFWQ